MDATRWQRLESLFLAVLDADEETRRAILLRDTRDDPTLLSEVSAMLAAHGAGRGLAVEAELLREGPDSAGEHLPDPGVGTSAGPYRLVERIGYGGMGVVYRAERDDGHFAQTVAIKLVRTGVVTPDLLQRFRAERQILARLQHDGIARLLDGGVTREGVPYLAMEHVSGLPITAHCDTAGLSIEERLRLFLRVCSAVHFAHQNLVVHRDLKPSNILVAADGSVKLLDFGIAKLLDAGTDVAGAMTGTMLPVLTPDYASPEQVRGEPVTTSTDLYALGLLLYELLCGQRAQRAGGASLATVQRAVCEAVPPQPSDALLAGTPDEVAGRVRARAEVRGERLSRKLRGDLDTIVATALRKEPERRYASAEQLASDVERYLTGRPVLARPDTMRYRAAKFARRNRAGVIAATLVVVSLVAGLALALSGLRRARAAEQVALAEAATANSVSSFLVELFRASDPAEARGDALTARTLLDRGAERVTADLATEPAVGARLLRAMSQAYESLGLFDRARELAEAELDIQREQVGAESVEAGRSLTRLAMIHLRLGDYRRSRELAEQAVAIQERVSDPWSVELRDAFNSLGAAAGTMGDIPVARSALERSLAIAERIDGPDAASITGTLNNLAVVHWREGDPDGARAHFSRAVAILEREYGTDHPAVANTLNNLALAHAQAGDVEQAIATHERVLAIREKLLDPDHPDIAESLNNMAVVYLKTRDFARARDALERALAIRERALAPDHEYVASTQSNLAHALVGLGQPEAAQPLFERALASLEKTLGPEHPFTSDPLLGLARLHAAGGDDAAAEAAYRRLLEMRSGAQPQNGLDSLLREVADFFRARGRAAAADSLQQRLDQLGGTSGDGS